MSRYTIHAVHSNVYIHIESNVFCEKFEWKLHFTSLSRNSKLYITQPWVEFGELTVSKIHQEYDGVPERWHDITRSGEHFRSEIETFGPR